jgi:hypothetical protein
MVFWNTYPIIQKIKTVFNNNRFKSLQFDKPLIDLQNELKEYILSGNDTTCAENRDLLKIRIFLKNNFGSPPNTPILDIPEKHLLDVKDHIIYLKNLNNEIIACIRYHYLGQFVSSNNEEIYCVDCFCISNKWRKKGLGDYLLTRLHNYVNINQMPYSLFLKEGSSLSIIHTPFYSSQYIYRKLEPYKSPNTYVTNVKSSDAFRIIDVMSEFQKDLFIIKNTYTENQVWKLYRNKEYIILACIQNTFQTFKENSKIKRMGWITAWIESSNMIDEERNNALNDIADSVYGMYEYIWANKRWLSDSTMWKIDGAFHWYLYQWATNINIEKTYCIMV